MSETGRQGKESHSENASEQLEEANKESALEKAYKRIRELEETMSIWGVLNREEKFKIKSQGLSSSHTETGRSAVDSVVTRKFEVTKVPDDLQVYRKTGSALLALFRGKSSRSYEGEADISGLVHVAADDAVFIINTIMQNHFDTLKENGASGEVIELIVRREASLFSNRPDHSVIFERLSGAPVFIIEDKKPMGKDKINEHESILGQVFDYLQYMNVLGHHNPFAALSTFEETWIAWDNNVQECYKIAQQKNRFNQEDLHKIVKMWPTINHNALTPSPSKEEQLSNFKEIEEEKKQQEGESPAKRSKTMGSPPESDRRNPREIALSDCSFESHQLVSLLCNAIICSLKNYVGPASLPLLIHGRVYGPQYVLVLEEGSYHFATKQIKVLGSAIPTDASASEFTTSDNAFYVLQLIGTGRTSKAFRAVSSNGYECVIKMYVRQYDESNGYTRIPIKQYRKEGRDAVNKEQELYRKVYDLDVPIKQLNGFQCLILPYFEPIIDKSEEKLELIRNVLLNSFECTEISMQSGQPEYFVFDDTDMKWRHCGSSMGRYFVFDLADVRPAKDREEFEHKIGQFVTTLRGRIGEQHKKEE